jgi:hypothetical protein
MQIYEKYPNTLRDNGYASTEINTSCSNESPLWGINHIQTCTRNSVLTNLFVCILAPLMIVTVGHTTLFNYNESMRTIIAITEINGMESQQIGRMGPPKGCTFVCMIVVYCLWQFSKLNFNLAFLVFKYVARYSIYMSIEKIWLKGKNSSCISTNSLMEISHR